MEPDQAVPRQSEVTPTQNPQNTVVRSPKCLTEDWAAVALASMLLLWSAVGVWWSWQTTDAVAATAPDRGVNAAATAPAIRKPVNYWSGWLAKPEEWESDPRQAFFKPAEAEAKPAAALWPGMFAAAWLTGIFFAIGIWLIGQPVGPFARSYGFVFGLALLAFLLAEQKLIRANNLEFVLWALFLGLAISNVFGLPVWFRPAIQTEFYIKTGLVLYGLELLLQKLVELGLPGLAVAWVVTPIVLITTFWFGQRVLRVESPTLNMVLSADMSVCGVSAAIATAAACRAKREELSLAIGISLMFTVVMMVVLPAFCKQIALDPVVAGAWIGGTIDSSGAVVAAGNLISEQAGKVAVAVKLIQNTLIGVVAFFVAWFWVTVMDRTANSTTPTSSQDGTAGGKATTNTSTRPGLEEIWRRFPKFTLGFLGASALGSLIVAGFAEGAVLRESLTLVTKPFREWAFCLAFVSIGLQTRFREYVPYLRSGKPVVLYVCGQSLNLLLTFLMAYLMFGLVFPQAGR